MEYPAGANSFHHHLLKLAKTEPLFAFSYFKATNVRHLTTSLLFFGQRALWFTVSQRTRRWAYDPYLEYARMDISEDGSGPWRITHANESYKLCPSYPSVLVVPAEMTDQGKHVTFWK